MSVTVQTLHSNVFVNSLLHFLGERISSFDQMLQRAAQTCFGASGLSDVPLLLHASLLVSI